MDQYHHRRRILAVVATALLGIGLTACAADEETVNQEAAVDITSAPAATTWQDGPTGLAYPVSDEAGPVEMLPVPHEFADTAQGAVVAAIVAQVFMAGASDELWPEVSQVLLEPGPGRDQWAQARALMSVDQYSQQNPPVFRGFQIAEYDGTGAVVVLAVEYPSGLLAALPVQMSRASGDWKAVLPTQEEAPDLQEITDDELVAWFTPFGPQEES